MEPSTFPRSVPLNSSLDFSIDISVSANAADGDAATFTVRAESTSNSDINDFISFDLVVTTSPPPEFTENEVCMYVIKSKLHNYALYLVNSFKVRTYVRT